MKSLSPTGVRGIVFYTGKIIDSAMKKFRLSFLAIAASLALLSCRHGNDGDYAEDRNELAAESNEQKFQAETKRDADFVYDAVAAQFAEIKLAELANQRSHSNEVKQLAEKIQTDHSASLNQLKTLAQAKAISVPVEETDASERRLENIADESGDEFDQKWCGDMLDMHDESIGKFEKRLNNTEDAELKAYLEKSLPVLKQHKEALEACKENLKNHK